MAEHVEIITPPQEYRFVEGFSELSSETHFWFQWRFRAFLQQCLDIGLDTETPMKVLDVGSGVGTLRTQIEDATKWTVDITDVDHASLQLSLAGRGRTFYYDILEKRADFAGKYDVIMLFDVLEHIEETRPFIEALLFHLKEGGYLFVNVPALSVLFSRFDEVQGHYRRYTVNSLKQEFKSSPLDILDTRYWGLGNVPFLLLRRFLLQAFSKNKTNEEIFREGFAPASGLVNGAFLSMMRLETKLTSRPPLGSSVLMAARKS